MASFLTTLASHPIVILSLLANLVIGFWAHRKATPNSFEDYALASRSLPTGVLVMTLVGTFVATGDLAGVKEVFQDGLLKALMLNLQFVLFLSIGTFIAPYLVHFNTSFTLGDLLRNFYGRTIQLLGGVMSCLICLLMVSTQINTVGMMSQYLLGIDASIAIVCFGSFVVFYSVWGGIRSVSYTDILQTIAAFMTFAVVMKVLVQKVGGIHLMYRSLPDNKKIFFSHPDFIGQAKLGIFWIFLPTWIFAPPIVQRMLITNDKRTVRKVWYTGSFLYGMICFMQAVIGLYAYVATKKGILTITKTTDLFFSLIKQLFDKQPLMIDVMFIGILAVLLSTMDSFLHAVGISFVQDIIEPVRHLFLKKKAKLDGHIKVMCARVAMLCIGFLAVLTGFLGREASDNKSFYFYVVIVSMMIIIPVIIGIMGIKTDRSSFISFCMSYLTSMGILRWLGFEIYDYSLIAIGFATLAYFLTHIYINGGIVTLKRSEQTIAEQLWIPTWRGGI